MNEWTKFVSGEYKKYGDKELFDLLNSLLVTVSNGDNRISEIDCSQLLELLDSRHSSDVCIVVCLLLIKYCCLSSAPDLKYNLSRRGAIQTLASQLENILQGSSHRLEPWPSNATAWLDAKLLDLVTFLMLYFTQRPDSCTEKFLREDTFKIVSSLHMFLVNGFQSSRDALESLILNKNLIGILLPMNSNTADSIWESAVGNNNEPRILSSTESFVVDLFDTSTKKDEHMIESLIETSTHDNAVWRYDSLDDDTDIDVNQWNKDEDQDYADVCATHILNSLFFWAIIGSDDKLRFKDINRYMQEHVFDNTPRMLYPGKVVCCIDGDRKYRAQIMHVEVVPDKGICADVFAIDYGFTVKSVLNKQLKLLDRDDLMSIPGLAHLCKLKG